MEATEKIVASDAPGRPGWVALSLSGRFGVGDAAALHRAALDVTRRDASVTVRCEAAEYLDVSAIQVLLCLGRAVVGRNKQFEVAGVAGALAESFRLAGLADSSSE